MRLFARESVRGIDAAIAGDRGIDTTKRLTREQAHDRKLLRKAGV